MISPYLSEVDQLLAVEWGQSVDWDVKFPDAPAPFNDWFPAITYERRLSSLETARIDGPVLSAEIPSHGEPRTITMSLIDDHRDTLLTWFAKWQSEEILGKGLYVQTLNQSVRPMYIVRTRKANVENFLDLLYVYPTGEISERGTSLNENGMKSFPITLAVAGRSKGARMVGNSTTETSPTTISSSS